MFETVGQLALLTHTRPSEILDPYGEDLSPWSAIFFDVNVIDIAVRSMRGKSGDGGRSTHSNKVRHLVAFLFFIFLSIG